MGSDSQLIADYEDIISTMEALNGLMLQPDNTSLQIILEEEAGGAPLFFASRAVEAYSTAMLWSSTGTSVPSTRTSSMY